MRSWAPVFSDGRPFTSAPSTKPASSTPSRGASSRGVGGTRCSAATYGTSPICCLRPHRPRPTMGRKEHFLTLPSPIHAVTSVYPEAKSMNVRPLHDRILIQRLEEGEQKVG